MEIEIEYMRAAITEARAASAHADVPIGCVVVDDDSGEIIGSGHNRREVDADPTAHAEILALREAAKHRGHWRLFGCTAYVTLEPCFMCAGAFVNARIGRVVYGAADPKAGAVSSLCAVGDDARLNHRFPSFGGVLSDECAGLLQDFFRKLRAQGEK